ncbi:MAG: ribosome small subunit-dependent GTPase A [Cytophagaceae bacterium]
MKGMVIKSTGSWYDLLAEDGTRYKGRLPGKFKIKDLKVTNPIAVGDEVEFEHGQDESVIIQTILPRRNYLIRKSVHKTAEGHLIASNLDQTLLVVTLAFPRTSLGFIDRFLVSAEAFGIPALLIFNKADLYQEELKTIQTELAETYEKLNYRSIRTSTISGEGLQELKEIIKGKKSLFSGHSGVGKSSLLNALAPQFQIKTSEISDFANKGVHTTTFAEMYELEEKTFIIDTPGIKELGIFEITEDELSHFFPEMVAVLGQCKFHNCKHINEPKCAVIEKVKNGEIALSRYQSYLSMMMNDDSHR